MTDVAGLAGIVFPGLSALIIEDAEDAGEVIFVQARTRDVAVACPGCGTLTARVHGYYERTADACRRPPRAGPGEGPPAALPGSGLPAADIP